MINYRIGERKPGARGPSDVGASAGTYELPGVGSAPLLPVAPRGCPAARRQRRSEPGRADALVRIAELGIWLGEKVLPSPAPVQASNARVTKGVCGDPTVIGGQASESVDRSCSSQTARSSVCTATTQPRHSERGPAYDPTASERCRPGPGCSWPRRASTSRPAGRAAARPRSGRGPARDPTGPGRCRPGPDAVGFAEHRADLLVERQRSLVAAARLLVVRAAQGDVAQALDAVGFAEHVSDLPVERQRGLVAGARLLVIRAGQGDVAQAIDASTSPPASPPGSSASVAPPAARSSPSTRPGTRSAPGRPVDRRGEPRGPERRRPLAERRIDLTAISARSTTATRRSASRSRAGRSTRWRPRLRLARRPLPAPARTPLPAHRLRLPGGVRRIARAHE